MYGFTNRIKSVKDALILRTHKACTSSLGLLTHLSRTVVLQFFVCDILEDIHNPLNLSRSAALNGTTNCAAKGILVTGVA